VKKRYRERALNELFAGLQSEDFDRREHALFQLALVLRRTNPERSKQDLPELGNESLPRELRRIRLGAEDQRQIVDQLSLLIASRSESRATAFWTLCEVAAEVGWAPTLALLKSCGAQLDDEAAFQACRALRRWLESAKPSHELADARIGAFALIDLVRAWGTSDYDRLGREASAVLERLRGQGQ